MYSYYQKASILPTWANLQTQCDFDRHATYRTHLLKDCLYLPPRFFNGLRLIEFGPDSGENALVFAEWGAKLTLVEPNAKSWPVLHAYFKQFNFENHLSCCIHSDLAQFAKSTFANSSYDFIVAEGFIQTVPVEVWQPLFAKILNPGGMCLISYPERYGMGMDLLHKEIYQKAKQLDPTITAEDLFLSKWYAIPHIRSFDAWVMDMLENPFVDEAHTLDTVGLYRQMRQHGFEIYSSWPDWKNCGARHWHKSAPDRTVERETQIKLLQNCACDPYTLAKTRTALDTNDMSKLKAYCNYDADFVGHWGLPYWFAVFEKVAI